MRAHGSSAQVIKARRGLSPDSRLAGNFETHSSRPLSGDGTAIEEKVMESLPPAGTRIRNAFNGETFIFTHVDEGASEFQCDIFIEVGGMKTGTGRQHLHPDADEEFIVKEGKLKLMVNGEWRMLAPGERCLVQRGVPHLFATVTRPRRCYHQIHAGPTVSSLLPQHVSQHGKPS